MHYFKSVGKLFLLMAAPFVTFSIVFEGTRPSGPGPGNELIAMGLALAVGGIGAWVTMQGSTVRARLCFVITYVPLLVAALGMWWFASVIAGSAVMP